MTEVLFYHLTSTPLEATLPTLLQKSLERGWTVCIQGRGRDALDRLDRHLWTFDDASFLPHGMAGGDHDALQPILLTATDQVANSADVLMLVDGAKRDVPDLQAFARTCLFFDGNDPDQVAHTRDYWTKVKGAGLAAKYWAQEDGSWVLKA